MTNDKIDLNSIPHPRDCHRVPVGAVIPKGVYVWSQPWSDIASYAPAAVDVIVKSGDYCLTAEPIPAPVPAPTPEDSPIIASGRGLIGEFTDTILIWVPKNKRWAGVVGDGYLAFTTTDKITEWHPAIVTKTGHGVMDERDKPVRWEDVDLSTVTAIDVDGEVYRGDAEWMRSPGCGCCGDEYKLVESGSQWTPLLTTAPQWYRDADGWHEVQS